MPQPAAEGCLGQWSVSTYHLVCRYSAPGSGFLMEVALYQVSILYPFTLYLAAIIVKLF